MNKRCVICGQEFDAKRFNAKVCGDECAKVKKRNYDKCRRQTPEYKAHFNAYCKAYRSTPSYKARAKAHRNTPEHKALKRAYHKAYYNTPERKAHCKAYGQDRRSSAQFFRALAMVGAVTEATKEPLPC